MNLAATFQAGAQFVRSASAVPRIDHSVDFDRLIRALELQLGGSWSVAGGAMQWRPADWAKDTRLPYRLSQRPPQSRWVARDRLKRWAEYLRRLDVGVTATILAMAWEWGLTQAMRRTKDARPTEFAIEVAKLYGNLDL